MSSRLDSDKNITDPHLPQTSAIRSAAAPATSAVIGLALLLLAFLSLPLLISPIPPLVDYPSHLARIKIIHEMIESGFFANYYVISSLFVPNILFDLVAGAFSFLFPIEIDGKIFLILALFLQLFGTLALHKVLHGRNSYWPLSSAILLYGWALLYGFVNYVAGVGLMLLALALWIGLEGRSRWLRLGVGAITVTIVYFTHVIALLVYAAAIAGFELQAAAALFRHSPRAAAGRLATGAAPFLVPGCLFLTDKLTAGAFPSVPILSLDSKIAGPMIAATAGTAVGDLVTAVALILCCGIILCASRIRVAVRFRLALAFVCIAYLLAPLQFLADDLDVRMPLAIGFLAIAAVDLDIRRRRLAAAAAVMMACIVTLRVGEVATQSWRYAAVVDSYRAAFHHIEPGSTLLVARDVSCPPDRSASCRQLTGSPLADVTPFRQARTYLFPDIYGDRLALPPHLVSLAAIDRDVFVPEIFSTPGIQPVRVRDTVAALKRLQGDDPVDVASMADLRAFTLASEQQAGAELRGHPLYLLMQRRVDATGLNPEGAITVAMGKDFSLFRLPDPPPDR